MSAAIRVAAAIAAHDVRADLRRPAQACGLSVFAVAAIVALRLTLVGTGKVAAAQVAGGLWLVLLFAALMGVGRLLATEYEQGTWDGLLLAPNDRTAIFLGKTASGGALIFLVHMVALAIYSLVVAAPSNWAAAGKLVAVIALADIGLAVSGTLIAGISLAARRRELVAIVLLLPATIPLVVAATSGTLGLFGAGGASYLHGVAFIALYDAILAMVGVAIFAEVVGQH